MQLSLFDIADTMPQEPTPGNCPHEGRVLDIGGKKSWCVPWETYTNCREVGHCVRRRWHGKTT